MRMKTMINKKGIVLLSSGLDSYISMLLAMKKCKISLALTFNYGQKAAEDEILSAKKIADKYEIEHRVINLPFLREISNNALIDENLNLEFEKFDKNSMEAVWIPNRNGLFLNIAGCYADKIKADYLIFGANKEEAHTLSDNSVEFIEKANDFFKYSTLFHPEILAPCSSMEKFEIINEGIDAKADFSLIKSCYNKTDDAGKKHCGRCESCIRLKNAILKSKNKYLINSIF